MLDGNASVFAHRAQDAALIILSLVFLPLNTFLLQLCLWFDRLYPSEIVKQRNAAKSRPGFKPKTILVTGVGMTKGLAITRLFYQAGHDVIGADFEPTDLPTACGRVSRSLKKFCQVTKPEPSSTPGEASNADPYIASLLAIVRIDKVDLWISCSGVASAVEDGLAKEIIEDKTKCRAIQFDVKNTQTLHEKHTFIAQTQKFGLIVPETHTITSHAQVENILRKAPKGRQYIMKTIGVDDSARGDMTLLPKPTPSATKSHISRLRISEKSSWILQQFIPGQEYCTHSLVVNGQVKAFVACPSAELLMHYVALPSHSPLSQAMLKFTQTFARQSGDDFTGHLSFDFLVDEKDVMANDSESITLYPIECNPRAHTAVCLFEDTMGMVDAYLSALNPTSSLSSETSKYYGLTPSWGPTIITPKHEDRKYYWIGHDLIELVLMPLLRLLTLQHPSNPTSSSSSSSTVATKQHTAFLSTSRSNFHLLISGLSVFIQHLCFWYDGTFVPWDPKPVWWLYHVYWPVQFAICLWEGRKWSRVNVSTTKMFGC